MKEPGAARALLEKCLPGALVALFDGQPELLSETFVEESLRSIISDVVFAVPLKHAGRKMEVFCIGEHKSRYERWLAVQLLKYVTAASTLTPDVPPPLVVVLVVHSGAAPYSGPRRFSDAVEAPEHLRGFGIDFPIYVLDIGRESLATLSPHTTLKGGLLALKAGSDSRRLGDTIYAMLDALAGEPSTRGFYVRYLQHVLGEAENAVLVNTLAKYQAEKEPQMRSIYEYLEDKKAEELAAAVQQATSRVTAQVTQSTLRDAVREVVMARFGALSSSHRALLDAADEPTLRRWLISASTAVSVNAVFGDQ